MLSVSHPGINQGGMMTRKKSGKIGLIFFLILVMVAGVVVFLSTQNKGKKNTDRFVVGFAQEPDTLHPLFAQMMAQEIIEYLLFESMVEYDENWNVIPRLVESIPSLENGGAQLTSEGKLIV